MGLQSLLKSGKHTQGTKRVKCPKCNDWIWVPIYMTSYIHKNCYTQDEWNKSIIFGSNWNLAGMQGIWGKKKADTKDTLVTKQVEQDCAFEIGPNETSNE